MKCANIPDAEIHWHRQTAGAGQQNRTERQRQLKCILVTQNGARSIPNMTECHFSFNLYILLDSDAPAI